MFKTCNPSSSEFSSVCRGSPPCQYQYIFRLISSSIWNLEFSKSNNKSTFYSSFVGFWITQCGLMIPFQKNFKGFFNPLFLRRVITPQHRHSPKLGWQRTVHHSAKHWILLHIYHIQEVIFCKITHLMSLRGTVYCSTDIFMSKRL
jgi:hypothetical protein